MRLLAVGFIVLWSCWSGAGSHHNKRTARVSPIPDSVLVEYVPAEPAVRDSSLKQLKNKTRLKQPLVVHVLVPLCDNENQGIVPVNKQLGDGFNLQTNLYWGAGFGIRSFFKKQPAWKLIHDKKPLDSTVLQRVVFTRLYGATRVYLVADAYRGDAMKKCVHDFLQSVSGKKQHKYSLDSLTTLPVYGNADLLVFNGHDGLMDDTARYYYNSDNRVRECALIACYSYEFFETHLKNAKAYPVITTTGLLAPEAYILGGLIDAWAMLRSGAEIRKAVANAYLAKHPKSGIGGCMGLFRTGWKEVKK